MHVREERQHDTRIKHDRYQSRHRLLGEEDTQCLGWQDKSGSNDASNLATVRSYQRCSYYQVSGHFGSELRRVTSLRADLSFSRQEPKLAKFGENAQLAFCNEFFSFRRVEQTPSQTITVHTGFSDRETDHCFGEWSEKLVGLGLFG